MTDLVEAIARALAPASWEAIDQRRAAHEAIGRPFKRVASRTTEQALDVIAALGLTEEHREEFVGYGFITPSANRWVTPWQEEEK